MGDGPYKVVQKLGEITHKIELLNNMNIFATFNVWTSPLTLKMKISAMKI